MKDLYNRKLTAEINTVEYGPCDIEMVDFNHRPDCKIGHFGYNFWYRTSKALKYGKYKKIGDFERAVKLCLKSHNITPLDFHYSINDWYVKYPMSEAI